MEPAEDRRRLTVMVVDDHDVVLWGFKVMLLRQPWVQRCLSARNGHEAVEFARRYEPHVALVDLFVGQESGPEICEQLRALAPPPRVLFISGAGRISKGAARASGASGFVPKDWTTDRINEAVYAVGVGRTVFAPRAAGGRPVDLTDREEEVLRLVEEGLTNRGIAERLVLSPHTVKEHTRSLYRKLGARNRVEAVRRGREAGLLD